MEQSKLKHECVLDYNVFSLFLSPHHLTSFCLFPSLPPFRQQLCAGVFPHHDSSVYSVRVENHPISWLRAPAARHILPPLGNHGNHKTLSSLCIGAGPLRAVCACMCEKKKHGEKITLSISSERNTHSYIVHIHV